MNSDPENGSLLPAKRRVEAEKRKVSVMSCDGHQAGQPVRRELAAQIGELGDVGLAWTRIRITRMGMPFAEIPHLVHRPADDVVAGQF